MSRPILLIFGEGDFSFSKSISEMDIYQGYDIIATEYIDKARLETKYQNLKQHIESLLTELNDNKPRFFIRYEIDITQKNWTQIFNSIYPNEEIRYPDIIQFNFP